MRDSNHMRDITHLYPMLCTGTIEYNPEVFRVKTSVPLEFIIEIHQILCMYVYVHFLAAVLVTLGQAYATIEAVKILPRHR